MKSETVITIDAKPRRLFAFVVLILSSGVQATPSTLRVATITDTHIGESCDELTFDSCKPMRNLRDAVSKLNSLHNIDGQALDGVFISGDLTSSALDDEFAMVRSLLDPLEMPWFPLLGEWVRNRLSLFGWSVFLLF